jgi:hypothetical protein
MASYNRESLPQAMDDVLTGRFRSARQSALHHAVPESTLRHRLLGRPPIDERLSDSNRLSSREEEVLAKWVSDQQRHLVAPNMDSMRHIVTAMCEAKGDLEPLGKHWVTRFRQRHSELGAGRSTAMDLDRLTSLTPEIIDGFFAQVEWYMKEYNIPWKRVYNMDEKGFQMGHIRGTFVVFSKEVGPPQAPSTGTSNWVSIVECIDAEGLAIPLMVIHIGKAPQRGWFGPDDTLPLYKGWRFGFSEKGWTDNDLGVQWLRDQFIPNTKAPTEHVLLILDGHNSHVSGQFQLLAMQNNVHLVWLPAHASHVLQPLDLGPFSGLGGSYRKEVVKWTPPGFTTIRRQDFNQVYYRTRLQSMTGRTIRAGWKLAGLRPWDIGRIHALPQVQNLQRQTPDLLPKATQDGVYTTPKQCAEVRSLQARIEAKVTPTTSRHVHKLASSAVEAMTAYVAVQDELKQVRKRQREVDEGKMIRRVKKTQNQRVWAIEQIIRSNAEADDLVRVWKVRKTRWKYIIAFRLPLDALNKINTKD